MNHQMMIALGPFKSQWKRPWFVSRLDMTFCCFSFVGVGRPERVVFRVSWGIFAAAPNSMTTTCSGNVGESRWALAEVGRDFMCAREENLIRFT